MDAFEFLKERKRLCEVYFEKTECKECPLENMGCWTADFCADDSCEKVIAIVERWSKEQPRKTRQTELLKMFPEAHVSANGSLCLCPASVSAAYRDENGICKARRLKCTDCCKEFWGQEVE